MGNLGMDVLRRVSLEMEGSKMDNAEMDSLRAEFARMLDVLRKNYEVPDVVRDSAKLLFILESPHVQELRFRTPVSGSSGASMSRHLFGAQYAKLPLGPLVREGVVSPSEKIALMNVLSVPLQESAYRAGAHQESTTTPRPTPVAAREEFAAWFEAMETVRSSNNTENYRNPRARVVQDALRASLQEKLEQLVHRELTIIPCGKFASKFFRLSDVTSPLWRVIEDVPHPSYNSWDKDQYQSVIDAVVHAFRK